MAPESTKIRPKIAKICQNLAFGQNVDELKPDILYFFLFFWEGGHESFEFLGPTPKMIAQYLPVFA